MSEGSLSQVDESSGLSYHRIIDDISNSLRRIDTDREYDKSGLRRVWHQGDHDTDLLSWVDKDGNILSQQLSFLERSVIVNANGALQTGTLNVEKRKSRLRMVHETDLIKLDSKVDFQTLELAQSIFSQVSIRDKYTRHFFDTVTKYLQTDSDEWTHLTDYTGMVQLKDLEVKKKKKKQLIIEGTIYTILGSTLLYYLIQGGYSLYIFLFYE